MFNVHINYAMKKATLNLNIKFYLIAAGKTDELHPLNVKIVGPLKRFAAKPFRQRTKADPDKPRIKQDACQDMVRAWETVTPENVKASFEHLAEQEF